MLLRTPQMLKTSVIIRVVHVSVEKQSAVAFGGKEMKPALTVVSWRNAQRSLPSYFELINLLPTEHEDRTGEYRPEVVAGKRPSINIPQYGSAS